MRTERFSQSEVETHNFPEPVAEACKRVRYRQSDCTRCADVCAFDAINFAPEPKINDACTNCGLCQSACPTSALDPEFDIGLMLQNAVQSAIENPIVAGKVYLHCHQAETAHSRSMALNCLGKFTENSMLAIANHDVQQLMITTGNCSDCPMHDGMALFKQATTTYMQLAKAASLPAFAIHMRQSPKPLSPDATISRRGFFRRLTHKLALPAVTEIIEKEQQIKALFQSDCSTAPNKRPSPRRQMLQRLMRELNEELTEIAASTALPWKKMTVDIPRCTGCGICVDVCPTGALTKENSATQLIRYIDNSLCTNCGTCSEACPQDIIRFNQPYRLEDVLKSKREVVATVSYHNCRYCGEIVPISEGDICMTCAKRQVAPLFM